MYHARRDVLCGVLHGDGGGDRLQPLVVVVLGEAEHVDIDHRVEGGPR
jgi:hypothetical protein